MKKQTVLISQTELWNHLDSKLVRIYNINTYLDSFVSGLRGEV